MRQMVRIVIIMTLAASGLVAVPQLAFAQGPTGADFDKQEGKIGFTQGARAGGDWSFHANTNSNGLSVGDNVTMVFHSVPGDRLHAVAIPPVINTQQVVVNTSTTIYAPGQEQGCTDQAPEEDNRPGFNHPTAVTTDYANQSITITMPASIAGGEDVQFCFDDNIDIGFPLTLESGNDHFYMSYFEGNNGSTSTPSYSTDPQNEELVGLFHLLDGSGSDVSQAGEAGTAKGFFDTTYTIAIDGQGQGSNENFHILPEVGTNTIDPRVTVTCPGTCTSDGTGKLNATFTVSSGADHQFVMIVCYERSSGGEGDSPGWDPDTQRCNDAGAVEFAVTTRPAAVAPAFVPALPLAGAPKAQSAPLSGAILPTAVLLASGILVGVGAVVVRRRPTKP